MVAFKCEMSAGYKMNLSLGQVALEGFSTSRDERGVVLSPDSEQGWLIGAKVFLELRIEDNIGTIVQNKIVLHLSTSRLADIIVIE